MGEDGEISRQLGKVEGKVDAIGDRVGGLEEGQREAAKRSAEEHAEVRRAFQDGIAHLERTVTGRLNKHAEEIDDLQESRAQGRGIIRLVVWIAALAAIIGVVSAVVFALIDHF